MRSTSIWLDIVTLFFIIIGALHLGIIGIFQFNIIQWLSDHIHVLILPIVYILIGISAIVHVFSRDYYLRFLGESAYPCGSLKVKKPEGADTFVTVKVQPFANVVYWAAEPNKKILDNPWMAYSEHENSGVVHANEKGEAVLAVRMPASYKVSHGFFQRELPPHIHYRTCTMSGMLDRVETAYVDTIISAK